MLPRSHESFLPPASPMFEMLNPRFRNVTWRAIYSKRVIILDFCSGTTTLPNDIRASGGRPSSVSSREIPTTRAAAPQQPLRPSCWFIKIFNFRACDGSRPDQVSSLEQVSDRSIASRRNRASESSIRDDARLSTTERRSVSPGRDSVPSFFFLFFFRMVGSLELGSYPSRVDPLIVTTMAGQVRRGTGLKEKQPRGPKRAFVDVVGFPLPSPATPWLYCCPSLLRHAL